MKTFKETDNLSELREGDRLEMNDGTVHLAVNDNRMSAPCTICSLDSYCKFKCAKFMFHFEKIETDEK